MWGCACSDSAPQSAPVSRGGERPERRIKQGIQQGQATVSPTRMREDLIFPEFWYVTGCKLILEAQTMKTQLWARLERGENSFPRLVGGDPSGPRSSITIAWRCLAVFASLGVLGTGLAEGAVGDRVRTVNLPPEVGCRVEGVADHVAISVAVVPRTVLGIAGERALLATSCRSASGSTIYFIDPGPV